MWYLLVHQINQPRDDESVYQRQRRRDYRPLPASTPSSCRRVCITRYGRFISSVGSTSEVTMSFSVRPALMPFSVCLQMASRNSAANHDSRGQR